MTCKKSFFKFLLSYKSIFTKICFLLFLSFSFSEEAFSKEKKLSGSFTKSLKSYTIKGNALMGKDQKIFPEDAEIKFLIGEYLKYREKQKNLCPAGYKLVSDCRLSGNTYFKKVNKNSCPTKQKAELYRVSKKLPVKSITEAHLMEAYKNGLTWILNVFVYPFYSSSKQLKHFVKFDPKSLPEYKMFNEPPSEYKKYNIGKACPKCSFSYTYKFKYSSDNVIKFDVTAYCSDKKTVFSGFQHDYYLDGKWKCLKEL